MDKNTYIAIILSVVILSAGFFIQQKFFMPEQPDEIVVQEEEIPATETASSQNSSGDEAEPSVVFTSSGTEEIRVYSQEQKPASQTIHEETDLFEIEFSTVGATITSLKLKNHQDTENDDAVEMIFNPENDEGAFFLSWGGPDQKSVNDTFYFEKINSGKFQFSQQYQVKNEDGTWSDPFTLKKTYHFEPGHYLFRISIALENSVNEYLPVNFNGFAYTLGFGPQLGPSFEKLDGRYTYRKSYAYIDGKVKQIKAKDKMVTRDETMLSWGAVTGKYFSVIGKPEYSPSVISWREDSGEELSQSGIMLFSRPSFRATRNEDVYEFYVGPKLKSNLVLYNDSAKNPFSLNQMNFDSLTEGNSILGWLEAILKFLLELFYKLIPNYGIAIILLTLVVKIVLFPLTHKSYESTSKMQSLNPKMTELREKYSDNPEKLNKEMADLYKKEGINPLGGCLPIALQFPILISLFWVFMKHFELRGAMFIPGWITDLSSPESILNFAPFSLPFIGSDLRLLPILMVGTQILTTKITQTNAAQTNSQMKFMTYGMPLIFFFILYNMPSGLLLYWTVSNLLTMLQQLYFNKRKQEK